MVDEALCQIIGCECPKHYEAQQLRKELYDARKGARENHEAWSSKYLEVMRERDEAYARIAQLEVDIETAYGDAERYEAALQDLRDAYRTIDDSPDHFFDVAQSIAAALSPTPQGEEES